MYHPVTYIIIFSSIFYSTFISAQYNRTDDAGNPIGYWKITNQKGDLVAKGMYDDYNQRTGEWQYYLSPLAQYTKEPDVLGSYENGLMQGEWIVTESRSKISMRGNFEEGVMNGVWLMYDQKGKKLSKGEYLDGIRHGRWIIYHDNLPMLMGMYENGEKIGTWQLDYFLEKGTVHVKGEFTYSEGRQEGVVDIYKVENHPRLGKNEYLVGTGSFLNGKKTGRWIQYSPGLKGEIIEIGHYDGDGLKTGLWETTIDGQSYQKSSFNDGLRQGYFESYYDNGNSKYVTSFEQGLETGAYKSYYEDGTLKEEGGYTIINREYVEDTIYRKIALPIEFHFKLLEKDFDQYNFNAIRWMVEPDFTVASSTLMTRLEEYEQYGLNKKLDVEEIVKTKKQSARSGRFKSYHDNGELHMEGQYSPDFILVKGQGNSLTRDYMKEGQWKEYDKLGYHKRTYIYEKGELQKVLDSHGDEIENP